MDVNIAIRATSETLRPILSKGKGRFFAVFVQYDYLNAVTPEGPLEDAASFLEEKIRNHFTRDVQELRDIEAFFYPKSEKSPYNSTGYLVTGRVIQ